MQCNAMHMHMVTNETTMNDTEHLEGDWHNMQRDAVTTYHVIRYITVWRDMICYVQSTTKVIYETNQIKSNQIKANIDERTVRTL